MGDAQSAQREGKQDAAAAEEESRKADHAQTEQNIEDKTFKNNEQSEINRKANSSLAEVNGHREDEIAAQAILPPDEDVSGRGKPLKETPQENAEMNEEETHREADDNDDVHLKITEMDAKQNDINKDLRRFFSNIGLKLTIKKGSSVTSTDVPDKTNNEEPNTTEDTDDTTKVTTSEKTDQNIDESIAQDAFDSTCPTLVDVTSEDNIENAEDRTTEVKEEVESDNADAAITSPKEDTHQAVTAEEELHSTSLTSPEDEVIVSPIKRFFATGIFSGLRKKKKLAGDETPENEQENMWKKKTMEASEESVQEQQQDKEVISSGALAATVEMEHQEIDLKDEIPSAALAQMTKEDKSPPRDLPTIVTEPEALSSQEKNKASPLKRFLSGSSFKKLSKKPRSRKSSDAKLSDSGEHVLDQLLPSDTVENHEEGPTQSSAETARVEDGTWASFKKLVTPRKHTKNNAESQIPGLVGEPKPNQSQILYHSTEEGKKRKDSSVSWEAVLCGSGRRRSQKTSDSEDETPQTDDQKKSKNGAESPLEGSEGNENETVSTNSKQEESPLEGNGGSTWKSLKRIVTPKRKDKEEDEQMKDNIQSDGEVTQDDSSFSIKKLLPGKRKQRSNEKQDRTSSDEADKDLTSDDEDSETPGVVPLSEFDKVETEIHIQTQADIESRIPGEENDKLQQDLLDQITKPVLPSILQDVDNASEKQASTAFATNDEHDDHTESVSKCQPLSDIPEEGIITETMATPASVNEEAPRDDTIAEDLIEITSEAITAPEPATDSTLADETEMISAVSQLTSESSKTSGNTTPIQTEYDITETDKLLCQTVETIAIDPKTAPLCLDELSLAKTVCSVSHHVLEAFVEKETPILEIHRRSDATAIKTGLNVEELDAINEFQAESQGESTSEVNDFVSTEVVAEVATEEFDTAEIGVDEMQEVNVTHPEESANELERFDDNHHLLESLPEINSAVSADILPEGEQIVQDVGSLAEPHQAKTEPLKFDSQEKDSTATVANETKDGTMEQEDQTVTDKEDRIMSALTDQVQVENKGQPLARWQELQDLSKVALLDPKGSVKSLEKKVIVEDKITTEMVTYKLKGETVPLTDVDAEKADELDAAKSDRAQETEATETVQALPLNSKECSVQSPEEEVKSEDIPPAETTTDEPKEETKLLTEGNLEPVGASKPVQEPDASQAVLASSLKSEDGSIQSLDEELISVNIPKAETITDEPKEETKVLTEGNLEPVNASKTVQEPDASQAVRASLFESEEGSIQSEKEAESEDIPPAETVTDEPKEETKLLTEGNLKQMDDSKTFQKPDASQAVLASSLKSEDGSIQSFQEELISVNIPKAETIADEPKEETKVLTEGNLEPVDASKTVQEPDASQAVRASSLDSEEASIQSGKEAESEDIPPAETITEEPKEETKLLTEGNLEPVDASKTVQSEEGSFKTSEQVLSESVPEADKVTDEPEGETKLLTESNLESVDASKTIQRPEVFQVVQAATLASEVGNLPSLEKGATSEDILTMQIVTGVLQKQNEMVEPEKKLPVEKIKTEYVHVPDVSPDVQNIANKTVELRHVPVVTKNIEGGSTQEDKKQTFSEETAKPDANNDLVLITDKTESEVVAKLHQALELTEGEKTECVPQNAQIEQEVSIPEGALELPSLTAAHVSSVNEESSSARILAKTEENNVAVTGEPSHEVQLSAAQVSVKQDKDGEVPVTEMKTAAAEHAVVEEVDACSHKDVSVAIPDVSTEEAPGITEPLMDTAGTEQVFKEETGDINLEHEETCPHSVTTGSEMVENGSSQSEYQTAVGNGTEKFRERLDERQVGLMQTPDIQGGSEVSVSDQKEDLEETKAETEKSKVSITPEEVKSSSEDLDLKKNNEQTQITQTGESPKLTSSKTELLLPESTGTISSIGNVESLSSLSLEFKLNIQFGQVSPPPTTDRIAPFKQTDMSEVRVQAVKAEEPVKPTYTTQRSESHKQTEVTEVTVQATDNTEPAVELTERPVIMTQSALMDVCIQPMETVEPEDQIKYTDRVASSVQATKTIQPVRPADKRVVFLSQTVLSAACDTKAEEPTKGQGEETDQDVWMDAEEAVYTQEDTEVGFLEGEGPLEPQTARKQQEKAGCGHETEMTSASKIEDKGREKETHGAGGACEIESEEEDYAVALDHLETGNVGQSKKKPLVCE